MPSDDLAGRAADNLAAGFEKWESLHFADDDHSLRRYLREHAGLRVAVERLVGMRDRSICRGYCHGDSAAALAALTGEAPRREDTPTGDSDD
ncbi:MAG: hypothetical protein ACYS7M_10735 [Planctomycetota bacterium]|jgi:hypothetical protein